MNILLVDDEPIFTDKLKLIIAEFSNETGIETTITGEAYSAQEALKAIAKITPDIVFTDIKMSSMNGIELAAILQKDWPDISVVIISGYPSFDYAREALRVNVVDYLLKPIDRGLVKAQLHRLHPQILLKEYKAGKRLIQQVIESDSNHDVETAFDMHGVGVTLFPSYRVLAFSNFEGNGRTDRLFLQQTESQYVSYIAELQQILGARNSVWIFNSQDSRSYILVIGFQNSDEILLKAITDRTRKHFSYGGLPLSIAFSVELKSLADMRTSIHQLLESLYNRIVIGKSQDLYVLEDKNSQQPIYTQLTNLFETKLSSLLAKKDWSNLKKEFFRLFQVWKSEQCPSILLEKSLKRMIRLMERYYHSSDAMISKTLEKRVEEIVYTAASFEEAANFCWEIITKLLHFQSNEEEQDNAKSLYKRIQNHLISHLSEPIGLAQLNERFNVSNTYLCNLFRNYANASFVEYFTTLRMDKAKELMRDHPEMMLKDIAELVGFGDHHYFSRVFKTVAGKTPSEYRSSI